MKKSDMFEIAEFFKKLLIDKKDPKIVKMRLLNLEMSFKRLSIAFNLQIKLMNS